MDSTLGDLQTGDRKGLDELFSATYEELRRLASVVKRDSSSATLNPTALVNEAWLKLAGSRGFAAASPLHFKRIAARAMRQVIVEAARHRNAQKRGSGAALVTLDASIPASGASEVLALEDALRELEAVEPRQAAVVETRFFGGMEIAETAQLLGVSDATVNREWRVARAWLKHRLGS
jgi:RNA polymerase sigma factor (TIGR02999 family)